MYIKFVDFYNNYFKRHTNSDLWMTVISRAENILFLLIYKNINEWNLNRLNKKGIILRVCRIFKFNFII